MQNVLDKQGDSMTRYSSTLLFLPSLIGALATVGCTSQSTGPTAPALNGQPIQHTHGPSSEGHSHHDAAATGMEAMKAELAKLTPEDAASAERQHICLVSGEMLGTMGPPGKVVVNDQVVWICCDGCREELLAHPEKHLAKLEKH